MSKKEAPVIFWFRNDLRLSDNPALASAVDSGQVVIPVYILDDENAGKWRQGGASRWWLHHSLTALGAALEEKGFHPLVLRQGAAEKVIASLIDETGASAVYWTRRYEPWATARDTKIKQSLKEMGIEAASFNGFLLFEPWEIKNKTGGPYKVFTPYAKACAEHGQARPPLQKKLKGRFEKKLAKSETLSSLGLIPKIKWYKAMAASWQPGEAGAHQQLAHFIKKGLHKYKESRDIPVADGVSRLSPYLHFGEISPHQVWAAISAQMAAPQADGLRQQGLAYLRQLIWREFSWHLLYHSPDFPDKSWNPQFAHFSWEENPDYLERWQKGLTGYPIIDAGMRQLWQTGWMHNRVRMIVGSFLVKNLLIDWRAGEKWFWDTLVDADLANNAVSWQWVAGSGADAAPYFRVFNPLLQSRKFDPGGDYIRTYIPELAKLSDDDIHAPWEADAGNLKKAGVALGETYPLPIVDLAASRNRALAAYGKSKKKEAAA